MAKQKKDQKSFDSAGAAPATKTELVKPLKVEINFPTIYNLKQALKMDDKGALIMGVQFEAKVDQFELFRLANILSQPHEGLYAVIGTPQTVMDFKFDKKEIRWEVFNANLKLEAGKSPAQDKAAPPVEAATGAAQGPTPAEQTAKPDGDFKPKVTTFFSVTHNHIENEPDPFGVLVEYLAGTEEVHSQVGRGKSPADAALSAIRQLEACPPALGQPFEMIDYLGKNFQKTTALCQLSLIISRDTFDIPAEEVEAMMKAPPDQAPPADPPAKPKRGRKAKDQGV
ncbi:MAG: hypothetical protein M0R06_23630 [Sphaerochaeta sp.]|jgi:hypothetical protein|nr:hypothetical protein [Sphaerochaeta sp.]